MKSAVLHIVRQRRLQRQRKRHVQIADDFHHVPGDRVGPVHQQHTEMQEERRVSALQRLEQAALEPVELLPSFLVAGLEQGTRESESHCLGILLQEGLPCCKRTADCSRCSAALVAQHGCRSRRHSRWQPFP